MPSKKELIEQLEKEGIKLKKDLKKGELEKLLEEKKKKKPKLTQMIVPKAYAKLKTNVPIRQLVINAARKLGIDVPKGVHSKRIANQIKEKANEGDEDAKGLLRRSGILEELNMSPFKTPQKEEQSASKIQKTFKASQIRKKLNEAETKSKEKGRRESINEAHKDIQEIQEILKDDKKNAIKGKKEEVEKLRTDFEKLKNAIKGDLQLISDDLSSEKIRGNLTKRIDDKKNALDKKEAKEREKAAKAEAKEEAKQEATKARMLAKEESTKAKKAKQEETRAERARTREEKRTQVKNRKKEETAKQAEAAAEAAADDKPSEPTQAQEVASETFDPFEGSGYKTPKAKKAYKAFMSALKKMDKKVGKGYKVSHSITK